jgi:hypothetical protein
MTSPNPSSSSAAPSVMRVTWPWSIGWGIAVILAIFLGWNIQTQKRIAVHYDTETEFARLLLMEKEAALKQGGDDLQSARATLTEAEESLRLVEARQTILIALFAPASLPHTAGKLFWNSIVNTGRLVLFELPPSPEDKRYHVWAVQRGVAVDIGHFAMTSEVGAVTLNPVPNLSETGALLTVTLEPSAGSPQPTGEVVLKGTIPVHP